MSHTRLIVLTFSFLLLGTALAGCSSSHNETAKLHRDRAVALAEKQQFREALTEYEELVKLT